MTERLCETCAHYDYQGESYGYEGEGYSGDRKIKRGWCRRWPPTLVVDSDTRKFTFYSRWPQATPSDWCGEWTKK